MYDPKCLELADYFIEDDPQLNTNENSEELAQLIQDTVENFIVGKRRSEDV